MREPAPRIAAATEPMTLRLTSSSPALRVLRARRAMRRAIASAVLALAGAAVAPLVAAAPDAASATNAGQAAPLTVTVAPGQSLNDIAIDATQSHDPGVLARAGRALFDANPQAFMKHDPSRLKIGATLTVPALDATGAAAAHAAAGPSAAHPASAADGSAVNGSAVNAAASGAVAASHPVSSLAAAASSAVAGSGAAHAAVPMSASRAGLPASSSTALPAASHGVAASEAASSPPVAMAASDASAAAVSGASSTPALQASAVQSAEHAAPASGLVGASGPHVWSGSIQSIPGGASEATANALLAPNGGNATAAGAAAQAAHDASDARPSSLQQLLALKNRVLMELQMHGIGKHAEEGMSGAPSGPTGSVATTNNTAPAAAVVASAVPQAGASAVASQAAVASSPAQVPAALPQPAAPQVQSERGVAIGVGAAVVALILGFALRRRKKPGQPAEAAPSIAGTPAEMPQDSPDAGGTTPPATAFAPAAPDPDQGGARETVREEVGSGGLESSTDAAATDAEVPAEHVRPSSAATRPAPAQAFPSDAIAAMDSLDLALPPRVAGGEGGNRIPTAPQSFESFDDESSENATNGLAGAPLQNEGRGAPASSSGQHDSSVPDATSMGLNGQRGASSSPLGGAQFGALNLDFDLDLPAGPSAALPAFTPEELSKIARNKLDLASEYVELGDLAGARMLLQEVIDAGHGGTRDEAQALLAKLADLS